MKVKNRWIIPALVTSAILLLAGNLLLTAWHYMAVNRITGTGYVIPNQVMEMAITVGLFAVTAWFLFSRCRRKVLFCISLAIFAAAMAGEMIGPKLYEIKGWIDLGFTYVYVPPFVYLGFFCLSGLMCFGRKEGRISTLLAASVLMLAALIVNSEAYPNNAGLITLSLTFLPMLLCVFLNDEDERKTMAGLLIVVLAFTIVTFLLQHGTALSDRLSIFLSQGKSDPYGKGWYYSKLIEALKSARLIGASPAVIPAADGTTVPAYLFFAWRNPYEYALAIIILRFGWLAGTILPLACAALASSLFRLSKRADDVYAGGYAYSVASYFSVKLFLNLMSCFVAYLDRAALPLGGNRYQTAVDVALLVSVIAFMRKTQGQKPVKAEKETGIPMTVKGQMDMENLNEMEDMCRLASEIFDECLKIMLETGCDFSEANKAYAERHPEKYEKIHRYASAGKEV